MTQRPEGRSSNSHKLMTPKIQRTCLSVQSLATNQYHIKDVPLGAKLPIIPGCKMLLQTSKLGKKLFQSSCDFDLSAYPNEVSITCDYNCFHDSHLREYFWEREDLMENLKERGFISSDNKVVCTLKEYNLYRQYLKQLSIEYFSKLCRERRTQERLQRQAAQKLAIERTKSDPNNVINVRLERAKRTREKQDRIRLARGRRMLRLAQEERDRRIQERKGHMMRRVEEEVMRETEREKQKKIRLLQQKEEEIMKEEIFFYWKQEDIYRMMELEERKKSKLRDKERDLLQRYERKKQFRQMKLAELKRMLEMEEEKRKKSVKTWQSFFDQKLHQQQVKFKRLLEQHSRIRYESHLKVEKSLRARGWKGQIMYDHNHPDFKRWEKPEKNLRLTTRQFSAMGFHNVKVPLSYLYFPEEEEAGDARYWLRGTAAQRKAKLRKYKSMSYVMVNDMIQVGKKLLVPLVQEFEDRTGTKLADDQVAPLLHNLCPSVFHNQRQRHIEPRDWDAQAVRDMTSSQGRSNKRGAVEEIFFGKKFAAEELKLTESQLVLEQTIKDLAGRVANRLLADDSVKNQDLQDIREKIGNRIALLASSVVNEILAFGDDDDGLMETDSSLESDESSDQSLSDSLSSSSSLEHKVSWIARQLVRDVLQDTSGRDVGDKLDSRASSGISEMSHLAQFITKTAIANVTADRTDGVSSRMESSGSSELSHIAKFVTKSALANVVTGDTDSKESSHSQIETSGSSELSQIAKFVTKSALMNTAEERGEASENLQSHSDSSSSSGMSEIAQFLAKSAITNAVAEDVETTKNKHLHPDSIDEVFEESEITSAVAETVEATKSKSLHADSSASSGISHLARYVTKSAITDVISEADPDYANEIQLMDRMEPMIKELSSKMMQEIARSKQRGISKARDHEDFAKLENKISKLALSVVESILQHKQSAKSTSNISMATDTITLHSLGESETSVAITEGSRGRIRNINSRLKRSRELAELDIERISRRIAKKMAPPCDESSTMFLGILRLASALAEDTVGKPGELAALFDQSSHTIGNAIKFLAESIVKETIQEQKKHDKAVSSHDTSKSHHAEEVSTVTSNVSELADAIITSTTKSLRGNDSTESLRSSIFHSSISETVQRASNTFTSALSHLVEELAKTSIGDEKNSISSAGLESALSSAVSKIMVDVISNRVYEQIHIHSALTLTDEDTEKLKKEVKDVVVGLILARQKKTLPRVHIQDDVTIGSKCLLKPSERSTISSAAGVLADSIFKELLGKQTKLAPIPESSEDTSSRSSFAERPPVETTVSHAVDLLPNELAKSSLGKKTLCDVETALNSAATAVVIDAISAKVLEEINERVGSGLESDDDEQLQREITEIVFNLIEPLDRSAEEKGRLKEQTLEKLKPYIFSSTDASTVSSAASLLASNLMQRILNDMATSDKHQHYLEHISMRSDQSTVSSAASAIANNITEKMLGQLIEQEGPRLVKEREKKLRKKRARASGTSGESISEGRSVHSKGRSSEDRILTRTEFRSRSRRSRFMSLQEAEEKAKEASIKYPQKPTAPKGKEKIKYHQSSFASWREHICLDWSDEDKPDNNNPAIRGLNSNYHQPAPSSHHGGAGEKKLDNLADRIIDSVMEDNPDEKGGKMYQKNMDNLVEDFALGVVTSLLGLNEDKSGSSKSPKLPKPTKPRLGRHKRIAKDKNTPAPSTGQNLQTRQTSEVPLETYNMVATLVRPSAPIPGKRPTAQIEDEEAKSYEKLAHILNASNDSLPEACSSPCHDNATDHPHRVPSPSYLQRKDKPRKLNKRKTYRDCSPRRVPCIRSQSSQISGNISREPSIIRTLQMSGNPQKNYKRYNKPV